MLRLMLLLVVVVVVVVVEEEERQQLGSLDCLFLKLQYSTPNFGYIFLQYYPPPPVDAKM